MEHATGIRNELPRRKRRGIHKDTINFIVASDGVLDPKLRNKSYDLETVHGCQFTVIS